MSLIKYNFRSQVLEYDTSAHIIIPNCESPRDGFKTLWLFHGLNQNDSSWCRMSNIERYVEDMKMIVVMPDVYRSFFCNMLSGHRYWDYIAEEIPQIMRRTFRLSRRREDNYVAGLSMGGYGAFKLALNFPERYALAGSLSGSLNILGRIPNEGEPLYEELMNAFKSPEEVIASKSDLITLVEKIRDSRWYPRFYMACGNEDYFMADNKMFYEHAVKKGLNVKFDKCEGTHNWIFWDEKLKSFLEMIKT